MIKTKKYILIFILVFSGNHFDVFSGPPFFTDDPEPVEYRHWEFYISSMSTYQPNIISGTLPHFEMNYGFVNNMQFHIEVPMNYNYFNNNGNIQYGYANTELGIKYRFIPETESMPQVGTFPIIEVPTIKNSNFSNNKVQIFLPVWLQKSWGNLTTYGGGGYWFNPGNKNWLYAGWLAQYDFSKTVTLGGELYYHTASSENEKSLFAINLGGFINFSTRFHFIFSVGSGMNNKIFTSYAGLLWTI
jgi:hypothetical protein